MNITPESSPKELLESALEKLKEARKTLPGLGHIEVRIKNAIDNLDRDKIEFAKFHVQAALKEALGSIPCLGSSTDIPSYEEVEDAVLNCYSLDKIK